MTPRNILASPWVPVVKWALGLAIVVGPWVGLYHYVPKVNLLTTELTQSKASIVELETKVSTLETAKVISNAATEKMRVARDKAESARVIAQEAAAVKAISHDATIAALQRKLATTVITMENECEVLKSTIDSYTIGVRDAASASGTDGGVRTDASEVHNHPPSPPS